eukprot:m.291923 g.291923  ORF g.291923 m.291923 type:complete len:381 (-) comp19988_c0_seq4:308-1450(-)
MAHEEPDSTLQTFAPVEEYVKAAPWRHEERQSSNGDLDVLFTVRSHVFYNGGADPNPPLYGQPITIEENSFVQIVQIVSDDWWIGRLIGGSPICGYVPTPSNFLSKHEKTRSTRLRSDSSTASITRANSGVSVAGVTRRSSLDLPSRSSVAGMFGRGATTSTAASNAASSSGDKGRRAFTRRKRRNLPVYEIAPNVRPLVIIGPSAPGFEITDKMQDALIAYLLASFPQRCATVNIKPTGRGGRASRNPNVLHVSPACTDRIFQLASKRIIPILLTEQQEPQVLRSSPFCPIIVQIRMPSIKILSKLIKTRLDQSGASTQILYTERFNSIAHTFFDIILSSSKLDKSCYELAAFLDAYVQDIMTPAVLDDTVWHASEASL